MMPETWASCNSGVQLLPEKSGSPVRVLVSLIKELRMDSEDNFNLNLKEKPRGGQAVNLKAANRGQQR